MKFLPIFFPNILQEFIHVNFEDAATATIVMLLLLQQQKQQQQQSHNNKSKLKSINRIYINSPTHTETEIRTTAAISEMFSQRKSYIEGRKQKLWKDTHPHQQTRTHTHTQGKQGNHCKML